MATPTAITLQRPLTYDEVRKLADKDHFIDALMRVDLDDLISHDIEYLNDLANDQILPEEDCVGLADLGYNTYQAEPGETPYTFGNGSLILHVCASVRDMLKDLDGKEDDTGEDENDAWAAARTWDTYKIDEED
jgi:hypothetical protein